MTCYLFTDHLGATVLMGSQNSAKNQLEAVTGSQATYYPFGDYRGLPPTQTLTDRGFTGQKSNNQPGADLGLLYYNARYYAPGIARFISADTIVPDPSNPQQFNRYAYTLNNPVRFTDPSGHSCSNNHLPTEDQNACSPSSAPPPGVYNSSIRASAYLQDFLIASGIDQTTFDIPRHINNSPTNPELFRYEIGAWVLYQEQNGYHPINYRAGTDGEEYFSIRGIYTSTVLLQVIQSREQNYFLGGDLYQWIQAHPTSGQFGYPSTGNGVNSQILNDFLILSYLVEQGTLPDFLASYPDNPTTANPSGRPIFFGHYDLVDGVGFYNGRESLSVSSWAWATVDWVSSLSDFYGIVGWPQTNSLYTPY